MLHYLVLLQIIFSVRVQYESIIATLCENLDTLDEPEARASMIWIIGKDSGSRDPDRRFGTNFRGFRNAICGPLMPVGTVLLSKVHVLTSVPDPYGNYLYRPGSFHQLAKE